MLKLVYQTVAVRKSKKGSETPCYTGNELPFACFRSASVLV